MDRTECCAKLSVQPCRGLMDEKVLILVQNAPPSAPLTVHSLHRCENEHSWEAFGHYVADTTGTVNVSEDTSLGGTYSGVEPMGLLWSLRPVPGSKPGLRLRKMNVQAPMEVTVSVHVGHLTEGWADRTPLAILLVERWFIAPGVRRIPVMENDLTATLFLPSGPGPFPGVLDMWGGGGKLVEYRASLLASHGFAAMALNYLSPRITLETGKMVDDSYFEVAYQVLQQHPSVVGSRIAMLGISLGSSVALKMAAYSKVIKPKCLVCMNGSCTEPTGGILEKFLNLCQTNAEKMRLDKDNNMIFRDMLLPNTSGPALKFDMGRLRCPLLLVVSQDDQNCPSKEVAMDVKAMMEKAGNSHLLTILSYPDAGHLIEPPYLPHTRASNFRSAISGDKLMVLWGGETAAHCRTQEDVWRKTLDFLRKNLVDGWLPSGRPMSHL